MRAAATTLGITCVDATEIARRNPVRRLHGWELKPFSILNCPFEEVIFLDADNVPLRDPAFLFESSEFLRTGAVFWPDYGRLGPEREIWRICDVEYRDEPEFESGQMVISKSRCWNALQLTMHLNEHSDYYYRYIHGDKDTFHLAWRMMMQEYSMVPWPIHSLPGVMCQHDFEGKRLFQHRNLAKWQIDDFNPRIRGFDQEKECFEALDHLRGLWNGEVELQRDRSPEVVQIITEIVSERFYDYHRVGFDRRPIEFLSNGRIGIGAARQERKWFVQKSARGELELCILGDNLTCRLRAGDNGRWEGAWLSHEQMSVRLTPFSHVGYPAASQSSELLTFLDRDLNYQRVGHDQRVIQLSSHNIISIGAGGQERVWWTYQGFDGTLVLCIGPWFNDPICELILESDNSWSGYWNKFERMEIRLQLKEVAVPPSHCPTQQRTAS